MKLIANNNNEPNISIRPDVQGDAIYDPYAIVAPFNVPSNAPAPLPPRKFDQTLTDDVVIAPIETSNPLYSLEQ